MRSAILALALLLSGCVDKYDEHFEYEGVHYYGVNHYAEMTVYYSCFEEMKTSDIDKSKCAKIPYTLYNDKLEEKINKKK